MIGLNCLFSGVFPDVLEFAKLIKQKRPDIKIALGGIHATTFPNEILSNCNDIDYIAIGEGENSIVALAAYIENNVLNVTRLGSITAPGSPSSKYYKGSGSRK